MSFIMVMRDDTTGEVRRIQTDLKWLDHSHFFWTEGNFGCDCNRHLIFMRDKDANFDDGDMEADIECGYEHYTCIEAVFPDGKVIKIDGADEP